MPDEIRPNCLRKEIYLPNEILAVIINEFVLDAEDKDTETLAALASCRLASHVLCSLATPLFFSSVQLAEVWTPWECHENMPLTLKEWATKLNQILIIHHIATSVQTLTLRCQPADSEDSIDGTLISEILHCLSHIRNFTLGSKGESLEFFSLGGDVKSAIQTLCKSPNLTTLDLDDITGFPFKFVIACPNLRHLRLSYMKFRFDNVDSTEQTSSPQLCHLDSLKTDDDSTVFSLASSISGNTSVAKYFSQIKNLQLNHLFLHCKSLIYGWKIMLLAQESLTTLGLSMRNKWEDAFTAVPFDLGRFPALRHLKIRLRISFWDNLIRPYFLNRLLFISLSTSGIETLAITITWDDDESVPGQNLFPPDVGWSILDELLTSEKFASLRKVVLDLDLQKTSRHRKLGFERNLIRPYVNALFPKFRALTNTERTLEIHV